MSNASQIISCPGCQAKMRVGQASQYRCPKCGHQFQLRTPASEPVAKPKAVAPSVPSPVLPAAAMQNPAAKWVPVGAPGPAQGASPPAASKSKTGKPSSFKKYGLLMAAIGAIALLGGAGVVAAILMGAFGKLTTAPEVAKAPAVANAPAAPNNQEGNQQPGANQGEADTQRAPGSAPYVGLDQIIWKPGDKSRPKEEGSGPRTPLVGHSMQANEVRTVEWKINQAFAFSGGDRKTMGEQTLRGMEGYIPESLVIDEAQRVVRLKYKGTVLTAGHYRTALELATELTLDQEPRFPAPTP